MFSDRPSTDDTVEVFSMQILQFIHQKHESIMKKMQMQVSKVRVLSAEKWLCTVVYYCIINTHALMLKKYFFSCS